MLLKKKKKVKESIANKRAYRTEEKNAQLLARKENAKLEHYLVHGYEASSLNASNKATGSSNTVNSHNMKKNNKANKKSSYSTHTYSTFSNNSHYRPENVLKMCCRLSNLEFKQEPCMTGKKKRKMPHERENRSIRMWN
jgi:hypothetical protein